MSPTAILLVVSSLAILLSGIWAWRLTSSRSIILNTCFGSLALLSAAYQATLHTVSQQVFIMPFLATMLFVGRFAGIWWRSRKEAELRLPAQLLGANAALALTATVAAFMYVT